MADIFVSYATEDRNRIKPLVEALKAEGWSVWWDRNLVAGPSFDEKIEEAIDAARCVVVAWSEHSVKSRWCRTEANEGLERQILVPLLIDDVRPPLAFRSSQSASLHGWPQDHGEMDALLSGIRQCLGVSASALAEADSETKSIAVLPFVNMSSDKEQEYFSDGLAEELLNLLAKIPELQVAARTSSFSFKGKEIEITEIASRLKVAHVLEGSVRKSGNRIRITAQLVQADNGYHLWSETYEKQLDDIFQIQDEIATAVVDALKISLLGDVPKTRKTDPQAYQLFLEGQYLRRQVTSDSLQAAIEAFKQAVAIDSTYVPAWANLADTYLFLGENALADQAIQTAISADPDYAYVYYVRGVFRMFSEFRFKEGIEDFRDALRLDPDDAFTIAGIGKGAFITGDFDLAVQQFQAALRVEPVVPEFYFFLGMAQRGAGRFDDAEASFRKMLSLSPQYRRGRLLLWEVLLLQGDLDAALAESQQIIFSGQRSFAEAITLFALGNEKQSDSVLVDLVEEAGGGLSQVYGYRGESDKAFESLNQAVESNKGQLIFILSEPAYRSLHSDPRWPLLLERINLLEFWLDMSPESGGPPE